MRKVLILALDGATFRVMDPWIKAGKLPNLAKFKAESAYGPLESTIPPITGSAWSSFQTGINAGKHGLFDWLRRDPKGYNLTPISAQLLPQATIWEIFSHHKMQVGVLGVPVTYPPRPVNGFMVSGLLAPPGASYTYPQSLQPELESAVPGYTTMPEHWRGRYQVKAWLQSLKDSLKRKLDATHFLMQKPWDVFMVHFMETDSVQHQMWHLIDGIPRPKYHAENVKGNPILEIFQQFDAALPDLLKQAGEDTTVVILSDHGFGPLHWNVYLNNWLLKHGYLKLKRSASTMLKRGTFFGLGLTPEGMYPLAERTGFLGRNSKLRHAQIYKRMGQVFLSHQDIDWDNTQAYSYGNVGQVYLNRQGREPQGSVSEVDAPSLIREIREGLLELRNPQNRDKVFDEVIPKEAIYYGPNLTNAPELMLSPKEGYMAVGTSEFVSKHIVSPACWGSGWHQMDGILMAKGHTILPGPVEDARLMDMAATLLYLNGLPVPESMDGVVLEKLFHREFLQHNPVQKGNAINGHRQNGKLPEGYEEEIRKRLQSLGYI